jgi:site-specific recombinase XerC
MDEMLHAWCGARTEGWVIPSARSSSGHLTTIAKGFQAVRNRAGLDEKVVPYLARHTYGTFTMGKTGNTFAVADSMGHVDLKSMVPYQHQELEPLRDAINERNREREERRKEERAAISGTLWGTLTKPLSRPKPLSRRGHTFQSISD